MAARFIRSQRGVTCDRTFQNRQVACRLLSLPLLPTHLGIRSAPSLLLSALHRLRARAGPRGILSSPQEPNRRPMVFVLSIPQIERAYSFCRSAYLRFSVAIDLAGSCCIGARVKIFRATANTLTSGPSPPQPPPDDRATVAPGALSCHCVSALALPNSTELNRFPGDTTWRLQMSVFVAREGEI